jgi:hypothetical protein
MVDRSSFNYGFIDPFPLPPSRPTGVRRGEEDFILQLPDRFNRTPDLLKAR